MTPANAPAPPRRRPYTAGKVPTDKGYIRQSNRPLVSPKPSRLTSRDKQLIAYLERQFPVVSRPFEVIAEDFDMDEHTLLEWITDLVADGHIQTLRPTLEIEVTDE